MQHNSRKNKIKRKPLLYIFFCVVTIIAGLISRSNLLPLPVFISTYAGDTLWALMVFWIICVFFPRWQTAKLSLASILFSFAIEFSQFYQAPWINAIRKTTLGALVLGFGFKFSDLICYIIGVAIGAFIDCLLVKKYSRF